MGQTIGWRWLSLTAFAAFMALPEDDRRREIAIRSPYLAQLPIHWQQVHSYKLAWHHAPTYVHGRVILLGDAAHSFTPVLGMGMNLAMEDAAALAPLLATQERVARLKANEVKQWYEGARRRRNDRVLRSSNRQGAMLFSGNPLFAALSKMTMRVLSAFPALEGPFFRKIFE